MGLFMCVYIYAVQERAEAPWRGKMERDVEELREYFCSGKTKETGWRKAQLENLLALLHEKEEDIYKSLIKDLGKHPVEAFRDEASSSLHYSSLSFYFS